MTDSVSIQIVSEVVDAQRYGVEYQPLVCCSTGQVWAYEALARFFQENGQPVSPIDVFQLLHDSPMMLARVEYQLKQMQLQHRPVDSLVFINLDPDAYLGFGNEGVENPLLELIGAAPGVVVELIENTSINDAVASQSLCDELRSMGKLLALDDVGAPNSMVALPILSIVDYIKFDRSWLNRMKDSNSVKLLASLVSYARQTGKKTVLEGVETLEHKALALDLGIDLMQGYLYRDSFIAIGPD